MGVELPHVGFLHPGAMGAALAAHAQAVSWWCAVGRSDVTAGRASAGGLLTAGSLDALAERCDVIVSVCPPHAAIEIAQSVAVTGFGGVYVDMNAISPRTARDIGDLLPQVSAFVDGGIVGPPPGRAGTTRVYLCGDRASDVAELWSGTVVDARVLDGDPGSASALKIAYATWTKATSAMLLAVRALARAEGVEEALHAEWAISQPGTADRSEATARGVAPKAWRFDGEMSEIASAFASSGLPTGFGEAAGEVYRRLADLRDRDDADLDEVLRRLLD